MKLILTFAGSNVIPVMMMQEGTGAFYLSLRRYDWECIAVATTCNLWCYYITIEGARRNKRHNYFIASNSMIELLSDKYESAEAGINDIMIFSNTAEESLNKLKKLSEASNDNVSAVGLFNLFE